jgi:hypothetical protein
MIAALCCVSAQALWVLADDRAEKLVAAELWQDDQSADISSGLAPAFERLLKNGHARREDLDSLWGVSGPGAFTGLRVSGAFLQGLARALNKALYGVSTFELVGEVFYIPLQHQKARNMDLPQMLEAKLEFLAIRGPDDFEVATPSERDTVWGLRDRALWPSPDMLLKAIRSQLARPREFALQYGTNPKIFGHR